MDPRSDRPDDAMFARAVFCGDLARGPARPPRELTLSTGCLVPQSTAYFCRCARGSASALLDARRFSHLPLQRSGGKTTQRLAGVSYLCTLPCGLMAKVELRGTTFPSAA